MRFALLLSLFLCAFAWPLDAAAQAPEASEEKAARTVIPRIDFRKSRIGEALHYLAAKSRQLDPAGIGVNLVLRIAHDVEERRITLALKDASLLEIVEKLAELTHCVTRAEPAALVIEPRAYQSELRKWTDDDAESREMERRLGVITIRELTRPGFLQNIVMLSEAGNAAIAPVPIQSRLTADAANGRQIRMAVSNVSLNDALRYLCESADLRMRISRHGVDLFPNRPSMDARNREWWKELERGGGSSPPRLASTDDVEVFLRRNGETAKNFAAAYVVTNDRDWLKWGLERFPDDPVLLTFACATAKRPEERRSLAARARQNDPESMLPWLFEAHALLDEGKPQDALGAFRAALAKPRLALDLEMLVPEKTLLLLEAGEEPAEAESTALLATGSLYWLPGVQVARKLKELAPPAGNERAALGRDLLAFSQRLEKAGITRLLIGELMFMTIASQGLELLPQDEQLPEIGMTPSAWTKQWETRRGEIGALIKRSRENDDSSQDKDPATIREYLRRLRAEGEEKALRWALDRNAAGKK